jgi:hypothetical protein
MASQMLTSIKTGTDIIKHTERRIGAAALEHKIKMYFNDPASCLKTLTLNNATLSDNFISLNRLFNASNNEIPLYYNNEEFF